MILGDEPRAPHWVRFAVEIRNIAWIVLKVAESIVGTARFDMHDNRKLA